MRASLGFLVSCLCFGCGQNVGHVDISGEGSGPPDFVVTGLKMSGKHNKSGATESDPTSDGTALKSTVGGKGGQEGSSISFKLSSGLDVRME